MEKESVKKEEMNPTPSQIQTRQSKQKKVLMLTFLFLLIGLPLLMLLVRSNRVNTELQQPALQVGDQIISKGTYGESYAYLVSTAEEGTDEKQIEDFLKEIYAEHYVLKQEYLRLGYSQEQLETEAADVTEGYTDEMPEHLKQVYKEVVVMKRTVYPTLSLKLRSGTIFWFAAPIPQNEQERAELDDFFTQQLQDYQNLLSGGQNQDIKTNFLNDVEVKERSEVTSEVYDFTDMKPTKLKIIHPDFLEKTFSTGVDQVSEVFKAELRDKLYYGIVYISDAREGQYDDYRQWLEEKLQTVPIQ